MRSHPSLSPCSVRGLQEHPCVQHWVCSHLLQEKGDPFLPAQPHNRIHSQESHLVSDPSRAMGPPQCSMPRTWWLPNQVRVPLGAWFIPPIIKSSMALEGKTLVEWELGMSPWSPPAWEAQAHIGVHHCNAFTPKHQQHPWVGASLPHPTAVSHKGLFLPSQNPSEPPLHPTAPILGEQ